MTPPVVVEVVVAHRTNNDGVNDTTSSSRMRHELLSYRKARVINDDYIHGSNSSRLMMTSTSGDRTGRRVLHTKSETRTAMTDADSVHRMKQHLINSQKEKILVYRDVE